MNFAISSTVPPSTTRDHSKPFLMQKNEAIYWYCRPFWQNLEKETGKHVDLYDSTVFYGNNELNALLECVSSINKKLITENETVEIVVGFQESIADGVSIPIKEKLLRREIETELEAISDMVRLAKNNSYGFVFEGD